MNALQTTLPDRSALEPRNLEEAMKFCEMLADSSIVPRDFQGKPGNVFVALQWGREVGLSPMQALQSIAVINGRPTMWGDAVLGLIRAHPEFVAISEGVRGEADEREGFCAMTRRGHAPEERTFSVADAKRAKLWNKRGANGQDTPWVTHPDRMLQLRARGFCARDVFADVLRGVITREEAVDYQDEAPRDVPNLDRGPMLAAPGSLAEVAASVTGREIVRPEPEPAEAGLPLVKPDGELMEIQRGAKTGAPAVAIWSLTAQRMLRSIDTRSAVHQWASDNEPFLASVGALHPDAAQAVRDAIAQRLMALLERPLAEPLSPAPAGPPGDAEGEREHVTSHDRNEAP